jgi:SAM-dependent methyltransferase
MPDIPSSSTNALPIVCTVVENNDTKWSDAVALFKSLLRSGGKMSTCERAAYFHREIAAQPAEMLAALGVALKVVTAKSSCTDRCLIPALTDPEEAGFLVAISADVSVQGDFSSWMGDTPFAARFAKREQFSREALDSVSEVFGTNFTLYDTRALLMRRDIATQLGPKWATMLDKVNSLLVGTPKLSPAAVESVSLGIALSKLEIETRELPSDGALAYGERENMAQDGVDLFPVSPHFNLDFDNASFWNARYLANPQLGSGLGSREGPRALKTKLIRHTLERERSRSVIDIGCGDLATVEELPIVHYTGIDIAEAVIKANISRHRCWKFLAGDFLDLCEKHRFRADLVLCFDVLIHQHLFATYEAFVRAIVRSCDGVALVGAFESPPRTRYRSEITAYHEPITRTLRRCGVKSMRIIANYRDTVVVEFARQRSLPA